MPMWCTSGAVWLSGRPAVDADVVALWIELFVQNNLGLIKQRKEFGAFFRIKLKERANVTLWNNQRVPG